MSEDTVEVVFRQPLLTVSNGDVFFIPYVCGRDSWKESLFVGLVGAGLVSPGAVDGDRGARGLVGRRVGGAEQVVGPTLGVERAHTHAVDLGAPSSLLPGGAAKEEGAGEDE